jgi:hypothetical protein
MFHGLNRWPGSFYEFHKIIGPLTRPEKHGGKSDYAFHVVVPSLPGTIPFLCACSGTRACVLADPCAHLVRVQATGGRKRRWLRATMCKRWPI